MTASAKRFDVMTVGRCAVDFYCNDIGAPLKHAKSFNIYLGGCPANVAVATKRLGLRSAILTRIGVEPLGDYLMNVLETEGVSAEAVVRDPRHLCGLAVLGIQPPDTFPLTMYRENCADINLSFDDVQAAPLNEAHVVFVSGTGFSREPSASATAAAVEMAQAGGAAVMLDIDLRPAIWPDARAFGLTVRRMVAMADLVVGTEEEIKAAADESDVEAATARLLKIGRNLQALVVKRGQRGATVLTPDGQRIDAAPFQADVLNVIGAGDAFISGFLYGYRHSWEWGKCARFGNATGAIIVTRHACANDMPYEQEALDFVAARGGF